MTPRSFHGQNRTLRKPRHHGSVVERGVRHCPHDRARGRRADRACALRRLLPGQEVPPSRADRVSPIVCSGPIPGGAAGPRFGEMPTNVPWDCRKQRTKHRRTLRAMAKCPACGRENRETARFCDSCGTPLTLASPAREERKVVTVLFADLVGFTSRAEQLDPEDVRALLSPYHGRLRAELEHFGGTVEKFIGDAVMALFGAPVAHEDDPERAVRAALAIRDWVAEEDELRVRIAVNTGEALVSLNARPEAGEGMASGDVVNTTARLQSAAPVNGILVGETTYRATKSVI